MATLNDVLKDVLEKDFDKEDVEKVVNPRDDEPTGTDREAQEGDTENEDVGQTYNGPGDYAQNSIGRSAVESFIKNSVYEKYDTRSRVVRTYSKMTPTEMLSDFGKTVGDLGRIRSDYQTGKIGGLRFQNSNEPYKRVKLSAKCLKWAVPVRAYSKMSFCVLLGSIPKTEAFIRLRIL